MIKRSTPILGNLAIFFAVLFWGLSFVSMKQLINSGIPPFTMIAIRYAIVCLVFIVFFVLIKRPTKKAKQDHWLLFWSGFVGITTYFIFESKGIELTTASSASMIIATVPIYSMLVDIFYFKNPVKPIQWVGILLSIAGVFMIIRPDTAFSVSKNFFIGNMLMLGACFSWVLYSILSKKLHYRFSSMEISAFQSFYAAWPFFLLSLMEKTKWVPIIGNHWLHLLFLALLCSVLSYFLYQVSLKNLGITIVSAYINLIPVVGVIGSVWLLDETVTTSQIIGGFIVILALFLVNQKTEQPVSS
jgi:drug/metabolite transporter (DMT)-like permease